MNKSSTLRIHLALLFVSAVFGINSVTAKIALQEIDPMALVCIRIFIAAVILYALHRVFIKEKIRSLRDYIELAFFSVFGIIINQTLFLKGLALTTAINATVLVTTIPVVTIVIAIIMGREKISFRKIVGSLISFAGVILLLGAERIDLNNQFFVGNVLVFINAVSFGVYLVISKNILKRYHPATVTTWTFIFGGIGVMPFGIDKAIHLPYAEISMTAWFCVAFLILFSSVIVYYINSWALQRTTSSTVAVYIYVQPIVATIISTWTLGETLTWSTVFAALLIFAGVFIVSLKMRAELKAEAASKELDLVRESMALKED
ncbi:DMT family transporter [bacterium]|nr:MAG: DMT family transporter [bacterium]